jgi:hypothetical protein
MGQCLWWERCFCVSEEAVTTRQKATEDAHIVDGKPSISSTPPTAPQDMKKCAVCMQKGVESSCFAFSAEMVGDAFITGPGVFYFN